MYNARWVMDDSFSSTPGKSPRPSIRSELIQEIPCSILTVLMICSKNLKVRTRHKVLNNQVSTLVKLLIAFLPT